MNRELELKLKSVADKKGIDSSDYKLEKLISDNVQELMDVLDTQGHSGFSIGYVLNSFNRLVEGKTLSPLTGEDSEWVEVNESGEVSMEQNNRMSSVFRTNNDNSTAYDLDARVFVEDTGASYTTGSLIDGLSGHKNITFPYYPTTREYVYVDANDKIIRVEEK